uniref:UBC core domain-containing protein n=1 Tax=Rhizochromulina marina TaxID=1034831 RepID=A0A7S2SM08_9STRA|mmetsp:Transcript_32273/g.93586  ORF Transcript_32273/g.93586 Transcript_32273/m.93586 type:complete len:163 (+) Transcript_32273:57-545(+)|eukprot:CAMPEP_0118972576 /NCGR_PEP_ID=MMETSP1173-20130426/8847_1 /TAXON_ID=1034831 /ORGANISM="Rhizochromulina marina cf, Strain CCMP1243" /LENGTH=162 /DNA_ID=CAMNT_0006922133 /DNA_START=47 /DNA_END=535 /DNA_ORIENTATION=+
MFGGRKGGGGSGGAAAADAQEEIIIPRNFKLLEELEKFEKGVSGVGISAGLVDADDIFLVEWNCSMLGLPGTVYQDRFYTLRVTCTPDYPNEPPIVRFVDRINMACVDQGNGLVNLGTVRQGDLRSGWNRNLGIEQVLKAIQVEMQAGSNRRREQPPEGATY